MKYLKGYINEGVTDRSNRTKDMEVKKQLMRTKILEHLKSFTELEIEEIGNDLAVSIDGELLIEIMFRDNYVGIRKTGYKYVDELGYNELGKMRFKITKILNER